MKQLNKQSELIRSLKKQLEATERELANEKWVFEQFLQSPSWRITFPIRWLARQSRSLRSWISGAAIGDRHELNRKIPPASEINDSGDLDESAAVKDLFTSFYQTQLKSFLASEKQLRLPHSANPEISVIIVTFNRAELTLACLRSLTENHPELLEVVIIDNASSDETPVLLSRLRGARVIRNEENLNFLLAVNKAARVCRGKYLLILNNDAQILPGSIESALAIIRSSPDIGAVGGRLILLDGSLQEAGSIIWKDGSCLGYGRGDDPFAPMYMFRRNVDYCSGAFLLTPRDLWNQLGGFDEAFKPAYYEETDYCTRLWKRGLRVVYDPNAVLLHYEFASSNSAGGAISLQREHQATFASRHKDALDRQYPADINLTVFARMRDSRKRILFIDDRVPHTWCGSGFPRSRAILLGLIQQQFFVTFYPSWILNEEWSSVYSDMPSDVEFMIGYGPPMLEAFLRNRRGYYDTIFVSRPHNMERLVRLLKIHPEWFENVNIVYDAEALFVTREVTRRQLIGDPLSNDEVDKMLREEVSLATTADCVISVSETEKRALERGGAERVHILGHAISPAPASKSFQQRRGLLFVGAIYKEDSPNGDSVIWFLEEVFPKIQHRLGKDVTLTIAGVNESERIQQLAGASVKITGYLPDLTELYAEARIFIAPTRYAAGLPHKVHEAAARGLPVVATPLLSTQLGWNDRAQILVGSDPESFANCCVELYSNESLWMNLRKAALDRITAECSKEAFEASLRNVFSSLSQTVDLEIATATGTSRIKEPKKSLV